MPDANQAEHLVLENRELRDQLNALVFGENQNLKGKVRELTENPVTIEKEITVYAPDPQLVAENQDLRLQLDNMMHENPDALLRNQELLRENYALRDQCGRFEAENLIMDKTRESLLQQMNDYQVENDQLHVKLQEGKNLDTNQTMDLDQAPSFAIFLENPEKILENEKIRGQLKQLFQNPTAIQYICDSNFDAQQMMQSSENFDQEKGYLYQFDQSKGDFPVGKGLENIQEESFGAGKNDITDEMRKTGAMDESLSPGRAIAEYENLRDTIKGLKEKSDPNIMQIVLESMVEDSCENRVERKKTLLQDAWAEFNKEFSAQGADVSPGDFRPSLGYEQYQERTTENFDPMQVESQFFIDEEGRKTWKQDQEGLVNLLNREKVELEDELRKVTGEVSRVQSQMDSVQMQKDDYLRQLEIAQLQLGSLQEKNSELSAREPSGTDREFLKKDLEILRQCVADKDNTIQELEEKAFHFESEFDRLKNFQEDSLPEIENLRQDLVSRWSENGKLRDRIHFLESSIAMNKNNAKSPKVQLKDGKKVTASELHSDCVGLSLEVRKLRDTISKREMEAEELTRALENSQQAHDLLIQAHANQVNYQEVTPEKPGQEYEKETGARASPQKDKTTIRKPINSKVEEFNNTMETTPGLQGSYQITESHEEHLLENEREQALMNTPSDYNGTMEQHEKHIESIQLLRNELKKVEDCNTELNLTVDRLKDKLSNISEFQNFARQERDNASPSRALTYNSQLENIDGFKGDLENLLGLLKNQQVNYDSGDGFDGLLDRIEDLLRKYVSTSGISEDAFVEMMNNLANIQVDAKVKTLRRENEELISKVKDLGSAKENLESQCGGLMGDLIKRQKDIEMLQRENDELRVVIKEEKTKNVGGEKDARDMMNQMNTLEMK